MWRLLLQAGFGIATLDVGRRIARLKRTAVYLSLAGVVGLLGLGALVAAAAIAVEPWLGQAGAAAAVGGFLVVVAALVAFIGTREPRVVKPTRTPIVERVRAEVGAAGAAINSARAARIADPAQPRPPGARRKRALNMVLIATLAGVILGRRL